MKFFGLLFTAYTKRGNNVKFTIAMGFILSLFTSLVYAEELTVGIKEAKPFTYQENGQWKGISVDLMNQLAKTQGFTYKFVPYKTIPSMLTSTTTSEVDMSIAAVSVTHDREKQVDFSHKYFTTSLGILSNDKSGWFETATWIVERLVVVLIGFIGFLYLVGFIMDKIDGDDNIDGAHEGAWWALVTFTTTGYGDLVPKTNKGKMVASVWMISSLFLISIFTGYVSSTLTVKKLTESPAMLADLYKVKVVVVDGSTAQQRLNALGIKHTGVENLEAAFKRFNAGVADAIVHDDAMLSFVANSMDNVSVWPIENSEEDYAIVLPPYSPLTERVNLGILKILASPEWKAIQSKYNVL